ncbi:MAG: chitobiase/beta-hexosaminidase C-terminal domain-containing protein [Lachnospiraceae bacterium]|nr:chitobiase/beta-hexosaminidase C-terminal domain-containing protein [Lachnospiraceae bacterium]
MKCPKCGVDIQEGKLLCESCGEEIHIVPDFEPEIENRIEESLSSVAEIIEDSDEDETENIPEEFNVFSTREIRKKNLLIDENAIDDEFDDIEDEDLPDEDFWDVEEVINKEGFKKLIRSFFGKGLLSKILLLILSILILCCIAMFAYKISVSVKENSFHYQFSKAQEAAQTGNYSLAITHLEKACELESSNMDAQYLLCDYYCKNNKQDNAIITLKGMISGNSQKDLITYQKIFDIYSKMGNISEINKILNETQDEQIREQFKQYLAIEPEFSAEEGSYDDVVHLKLTGNTTGKIYYTLDGSMPDSTSTEYTSPICLDNGFYTVKAIFVNSFGLMSEIVTKKYEINVMIPDAPEVTPASGTFRSPEKIVVQVPVGCNIYYTTNGEDPTIDSNLYSGPLCMSLGKSKLKFISYSEENRIYSEITEVEYSLQLPEMPVSAATAANIITEYRYSLGGMESTTGELSTISGKLLFMCESAVNINGELFYVICEYYEDPTAGIRTKTGLVYCVSMTDPARFGTLELGSNQEFYWVEHIR